MRDADVRRAVRDWLAAEHDGDPDTRIVEEMGIWNGTVRVDLAVVNGELTGFEIKSAKDTLARLPAQAALYNTVFDRVCLVAAEKHISRAAAEVPGWWGVIVARPAQQGVDLEEVRAGGINPDVDPIQVARLLWRTEALELLVRYGAAKGVRSASREKLSERLVQSLAPDILRHEVRRCLKDRPAWLGEPVGNERDVPISRET